MQKSRRKENSTFMTNFYLKTKVRLLQIPAITALFVLLFFASSAYAQDNNCGSDYLHNQHMQNDPNYAIIIKQYEHKLQEMMSSDNVMQTMTTLTPPYQIPVVVHVMQDSTDLTAISKEVIRREILRLNQRMRKIQGSIGDGDGVDTQFEFVLAVRDPNGNSTDGITYYDLSGNSTYVNSGVKWKNTDAGIPTLDMLNLRRWDPTKYYNIWLVNKIGGGNPNTAGGFAPGAGAHGQNYDGSVILASQFNSLDVVTAHELGHAFNLKHTFEGSNGVSCPPQETTVSQNIDISSYVLATQGETYIYTGSNNRKYYVSQVFVTNNGGNPAQQIVNSWGTSNLPAGVYYINLNNHLLVQNVSGTQRYFVHKNFFTDNNNQGPPYLNWINSWNIYELPSNVYAVNENQQNLIIYPPTHCSRSGDLVCDTPRHPKTLGCDDNNNCEGNSDWIADNYMSYASGDCQKEFTQGQKVRMQAALQLRKSFLASEGNMSLVPVTTPVAEFELPNTTCIGTSIKLFDLSKNIPNTFLDQTAWNGISFVWSIVHQNGSSYTMYEQNPQFTFTLSGNYTVKLTVTNSFGSHSKIRFINVVEPFATPAACAAPGSFNPSGYYDLTINKVSFNTINNITDLRKNGVYNDYSCEGGSTTVDAGATYPLTISVKSNSNPYRFEAYIDWNNNGIFEYPSELVSAGEGTANQNTTFSGNLTIPNTAVMGTLLRMRVIGEEGEITNEKRNCTQVFTMGDTEDYGVYVNGTPLCPPGDVIFTTQAQVNQFATTYPNCTQIAGYLSISNSSGATAITNLSPLSNITSIGGSLDINNNALLTNLNGLSGLLSVGQDLNISLNPALTDVNGLSNLTTLNGFLNVNENAALTSISGLQNVNPATISGNIGLNITNNPLLTVCDLPNFCSYLGTNGAKNIQGNAGNCISTPILTAICYPPVCPEGNITFTSQTQINQFVVDYPNCTAISGTLTISGADITNLLPLSGLTNITDNLYITNTSLSDLNGLNAIINISGDVEISTNATLTSLNGLNNLTNTIGDFILNENAALTNVDALTNLTNINGSLVINNNAVLNNISGLQNLNPNSIGGEYGLMIANNPQLSVCNNLNFCVYLLYPTNTHPRNIFGNAGDCASEQALKTICYPVPAECPVGNITLSTQAEVNQFITDYPNCTVITGNLRIGVESGNSNITDISQLYHLTTVTGNVFISYNSALQNLAGLDNLSNIGGLFIQNNGLKNLNGLSSLTNATNLLIGYNNLLTNINGLSGLTSVTGSVIIQSNNALTNINGLNNLTTVTGILTIKDNSTLSNISGIKNINPATFVPAGNNGVTIQNNPILSVCNLPNLCTYLQNPSNPSEISGNAGNCISSAAVTTACTTTPINDCPSGTVMFTSQAQVNAFLEQYPNCTEISGDLKIGNVDSISYPTPYSNINNLAPLNNITKIVGSLEIARNPALQNLTGLNNLTTIGGDFSYRLEKTIIGNTTTYPLNSLLGLNNLTSIGGNLKVMRINKFDGLNNLTNIGGDLSISSAYSGVTNGNMDGFSSLTTIGGKLMIETRAKINDLDGLSSLTSLGGLFIRSDNAITNLNAFNNITSLGGGEIVIIPMISNWSNNTLTDISGLQNIDPSTISNLKLLNNTNLGICDLPNLCEYLSNPANPRELYGNKISCNASGILTACEAQQTTCPQDDVYLSSQADVNQFATNYPNCTTISGNLFISDAGITSLAPLSGITTIGGNLDIRDTSLTNLSGLHNVTSLGGNPSNGFNATSSIGGSITIENNYELINISALQNINPATINGLYILYNYDLPVCNLPNFCTYLSNINNPRNISGNAENCVSMQAVAAACNIGMPTCPPGDIYFGGQDQINQFIIDYPNCTEIAGHVGISTWSEDTNNAVSDLSPLTNLTSILGDLSIEYNSHLSSLNGLHNLTYVGGSIDIAINSQLSNISALKKINPNSFTSLNISENPILSVCNLPNFCTYLSLSTITHPRSIFENLNNCLDEVAVVNTCANTACPSGNVVLTSQSQIDQFVSDYPNCSMISGHLTLDGTLSGDDVIINLTGLSNIQNISGQLNIVHNTELYSLNGLDSVKNVGSNLWISNNTSLTHINNVFSSLESAGHLYIGYNPNLYSAGQFDALTNLTSNLTIEQNPQLNDIEGLNNLNNVGGQLKIHNNSILNDISSLQNINPTVLNNLIITANPELSFCNLPNICNYIANIAKPRTISGNTGNCISEVAVTNACMLSINDPNIHKLTYYPNPVTDILYLSHNTQITHVTVVNMLGQIIINQKVGSNTAQIDMQSLPEGNYIVRVTSEAGTKTIKAIKQ